MVAQTSWAPKRLPSCQSTSSRSFQVTHIAGDTAAPPLLTAGHPEVRTSPLAVVGTSVASIGRQKSARLRAFAVSSRGRYQSRPSTTGAVNINGTAQTIGRTQYQPQIAVDQSTGNLVVSFLDARNDPSDARVATYVAVSPDGGNTFAADVYAFTPEMREGRLRIDGADPEVARR